MSLLQKLGWQQRKVNKMLSKAYDKSVEITRKLKQLEEAKKRNDKLISSLEKQFSKWDADDEKATAIVKKMDRKIAIHKRKEKKWIPLKKSALYKDFMSKN